MLIDILAFEPGITERELEVVRLGALGLTYEETAAELSISFSTVQTHWRHVFRKLGARSRAHAVALAFSRGLLVLSES